MPLRPLSFICSKIAPGSSDYSSKLSNVKLEYKGVFCSSSFSPLDKNFEAAYMAEWFKFAWESF